MGKQTVSQLVDHLFRHEAGKMAAVLTRIVGLQNLELAQDLVQDTLLKAIHTWKIKGIPKNPSAWLYTVAKRKAIDAVRQRKVHHAIEADLARAFQSEWTLAPAVGHLFDHEIEDSLLRMMFVCCHPSLPNDAQLALILKTLCGLSIAEIAQGLLTTEEAVAKRLYRVREKIRTEQISLEIPSAQTLRSRLETVLHTLYLLFSEGYNSSHPDQLMRHDLCAEAMRLCLLLTKNPLTDLPATRALMALMCFQAARAEARLDKQGSIILLRHQDRTLWDQSLINKGIIYLEAAADEPLSEYHLEAAIAACHARAASFEATDWKMILRLYEVLSSIQPNPFVEMNKAIARGMAESPQQGLTALKGIAELKNYALYQTAMGDFHQQLGDTAAAKYHYTLALGLTKSNPEIELLREKLLALNDNPTNSAADPHRSSG